MTSIADGVYILQQQPAEPVAAPGAAELFAMLEAQMFGMGLLLALFFVSAIQSGWFAPARLGLIGW